MDGPWKHYAQQKKEDRKGHIVRFHFFEMSRIGKVMETDSRLAVVRKWEEQSRVIFLEWWIVLELDKGVGCTTWWVQ